MINTENGSFRNCMAIVIDRIETDYGKDIMNAYNDKDIESLAEWLEANPEILGTYMMNFINNHSQFDFDEYQQRDSETYR
jgi:hypothetical protein